MATDKVNEQEIQFRKRARRRLVGAVVLVLLMITVLPMILDEHESKAPLPEIAISIPSQNDTGFASKVVPDVPSSPVSEPPHAQSGVPLSSPLEKPQQSPIKNSVSGAAGDDANKPKTTRKPAPSGTSAAATPASTPEPSATSSGTQAAPLGQGSVVEGVYLVQIGVYSDAVKVKQLQARLDAQGLQSYTENLATPKGIKIRLRVGPYTTRAQAEQSRDAVKAAGLDGMVVVSR